MRWLKESNPVTEGIECDGRRNRMRWLKESNAVAEGDECDGRRRRMRWLEETVHEPLNRFYTIIQRANSPILRHFKDYRRLSMLV